MATASHDMALKLAMGKVDMTAIDPSKKTYSSSLNRGIFYTQYVVEAKALAYETVKYVKHNLPELDSTVFQKMPDTKFTSVGKFCYIIMHGGKLKEDMVDSLNRALKDMYEKGVNEVIETTDTESPVTEAATKSVPDPYDRTCEVCSEYEEMFDEFCKSPSKYKFIDDPKSVMIAGELKPAHLRHVSKIYQPLIKELQDVLKGDDQDLVEGYSYLKKTQVKRYLAFVESIVEGAEFLKMAESAPKKPRAAKPLNINRMVSKLNYLSVYEGIKSISPVQIVGASEIWVYNTRTRKLGYYTAFDSSGLLIKGTSIANYGVDSMERSIRSSIAFDIGEFMNFNKTTKRKEFNSFSTVVTKMTGRINGHVLILSANK